MVVNIPRAHEISTADSIVCAILSFNNVFCTKRTTHRVLLKCSSRPQKLSVFSLLQFVCGCFLTSRTFSRRDVLLWNVDILLLLLTLAQGFNKSNNGLYLKFNLLCSKSCHFPIVFVLPITLSRWWDLFYSSLAEIIHDLYLFTELYRSQSHLLVSSFGNWDQVFT